ncbi:MAG: BamA/TamA family outer membrane protein [bacterium]|nr:BamA/TamA family outer membrane protein [bacterium]
MGLVLSGGGARGAAHVGVLKVLEELRVPVDFIVGTSMGAIVGGMYSTGLSPATMLDRIAEVDWQDAFNDAPARRYVAFRQKEDDDLPLFRFELGLGRNGLSYPAGFVAGQKLNFIIRSMLLHAAEERPFDDFPIPFRAVAADLETGEMVVLDHGELAKAIRASMAFPVMFTPVQIGERLLVDGGVVRNLPVDVALEMGADHLIAIDVGTPLGEMLEDPTAMGVMLRTMSVMAKQSVSGQRDLIREQDLLIVPELTGIMTFEGFGEVETAVERGIAAARLHEERLREFSVSEQEFDEYLQRQRSGTGIEDRVISKVEITGLERVSPKLVRRRVKSPVGESLNLAELQADLERVYQIGEFEQVEFGLRPENEGHTLEIRGEEKSWGPWYLRFGAATEANLDGRGQFAATALVRRTQINALGAEWKTFFTLGGLDSVSTEFYQPVEYSGTFFVAPRLFFAQDGDEIVFENGEQILAEIDRTSAGFDLGANLGNFGEVRLGAVSGRIEGRRLSGDTTPVDVDTGDFNLSATLDQLDNANFPRAGSFAELRLFLSRSEIGADDEFEQLFVGGAHAKSFGRQTLIGSAIFGTDLGSDLPFYADFGLGGFLNLSGLKQGELAGRRLGLARLVSYRKFGETPGPFGGSLYLGGSLEAGNVWPDPNMASLSDLRRGGSVFVGLDTVLGPIFLAYGKAESASGTFYLFLGQVF